MQSAAMFESILLPHREVQDDFNSLSSASDIIAVQHASSTVPTTLLQRIRVSRMAKLAASGELLLQCVPCKRLPDPVLNVDTGAEGGAGSGGFVMVCKCHSVLRT